MPLIFDKNSAIQHINWAETSVVIPAVSVGNVAQLAVDLVLASEKDLQYVGFWYDAENLVPFVAHDCLSLKEHDQCGKQEHGVTFYYCATSKTVFVQQRALIHPKRVIPFVNNLISFFKENSTSSILLLTSTNASKREDEELNSSNLFSFFAVEPGCKESEKLSEIASAYNTPVNPPSDALAQPLAKKCVSLGWEVSKPREDLYVAAKRGGYGPYAAPQGSCNEDIQITVTPQPLVLGKIYFPIFVVGNGITLALARACRRADIPLAGLVAAVYPGDNRPVASQMATKLIQYVTNDSKKTIELREPLAWRYLFQ